MRVLVGWLGFSVVLGLVLGVGGRAVVSWTAGNPLSRLDLTGHGELLPGAVVLSMTGIRYLLAKPANTAEGEREIFGILCALLGVFAALWLGSILTFAAEKVTYSGPNIANGSLLVYIVAGFVGGYCVVRSDRR
jgi:hypothetical protein